MWVGGLCGWSWAQDGHTGRGMHACIMHEPYIPVRRNVTPAEGTGAAVMQPRHSGEQEGEGSCGPAQSSPGGMQYHTMGLLVMHDAAVCCGAKLLYGCDDPHPWEGGGGGGGRHACTIACSGTNRGPGAYCRLLVPTAYMCMYAYGLVHAYAITRAWLRGGPDLQVAGGRGYYLINEGPLLNQALITFSLQFGYKRGFSPVHTPFFMRQEIMGECAQLSQFDDELYKVTGG